MAGNLAGQDFQSASSVTPPSGRVGQAPPQGAATSESLTSVSANGNLGDAEFSGLLRNFASAEVSVKLSENGSPRASALASPASKPENSVNVPANLILHPAPTSESVENSQASLSSSASPDPSRQLDANSQASSPATISRRRPGSYRNPGHCRCGSKLVRWQSPRQPCGRIGGRPAGNPGNKAGRHQE